MKAAVGTNEGMKTVNRLAVITGGTKGLGRAVAERLLRDGFDVGLTYANDAEQAERTSQELLAAHPESEVTTFQADASDFSSIDVIEEFVIAQERQVDALVLNAGITDRGSLEDLQVENWLRVFNANVHVPLFTIQHLLDHFTEDASVVLTGSLMGIQPHSMSLAYGVTKSTVHALVENLVKFLAPRGVRVNAVAPGFIDTEWQLTKPAEIRASINSKISLGRFALPEEIADTYAMLINNAYFNGETLVVDGGYSYR